MDASAEWIQGSSFLQQLHRLPSRRRLGIKYREKEGAAPKGFVHTLNSTAVATGRTIVALLENNQQEDGTINIPVALRKYMGNREKIDKKR